MNNGPHIRLNKNTETQLSTSISRLQIRQGADLRWERSQLIVHQAQLGERRHHANLTRNSLDVVIAQSQVAQPRYCKHIFGENM